MNLNDRTYILALTGMVLGILIALQIRSYEGVANSLVRDTSSSVFQEIAILKSKNEDLRREIADLEDTMKKLNDQNFALAAVEEDINKYKKLNGRFAVFGPGITINTETNLSTPWLIDLMNECFTSGAEAVAINGIRLTRKTVGFDTLPQGQILLNGSVLAPPFEFNVIGDAAILTRNLEIPGGIFDRLKAAFPNIKLRSTAKEIIQMN